MTKSLYFDQLKEKNKAQKIKVLVEVDAVYMISFLQCHLLVYMQKSSWGQANVINHDQFSLDVRQAAVKQSVQ